MRVLAWAGTVCLAVEEEGFGAWVRAPAGEGIAGTERDSPVTASSMQGPAGEVSGGWVQCVMMGCRESGAPCIPSASCGRGCTCVCVILYVRLHSFMYDSAMYVM